MTFKPGSEFKNLRWVFFLLLAIAYGSSALGWSPRPSASDLSFGVLFFIFIALTDVGIALERIAPPESRDQEESAS